MKYVCIDNGAVEELISGRVYQSIDFSEGMELLELLSSRKPDSSNIRIELLKRIGRCVISISKDYVFISTEGHWKKKKFLIIDSETSKLFSSLPKSDTLVSFQKLLRFCIKYWSNDGNFNRSEHIVKDSSKAVLYPLPDSKGGVGQSFRIVVEREPDKHRLKSRDMDGQFLLAYETCNAPKDYEADAVGLTNFRKALEEIPKSYNSLPEKLSSTNNGNSSSPTFGTSLDDMQNLSSLRSFLPFSSWLQHLTRKQMDFVTSSHTTPHRIIGPAGSGKTLSLLLKTIACLKRAEKNSMSFRALIITHSEATKSAILENLEVLDPERFYTRESSEFDVTLQVQTLASLCGHTLSREISETEFIDRDAQDSKIMQLLYIENALKATKEKEYASHKPFLSTEFRKLLEEQDDASLSTLFQHEISILIKGRADDSFDEYKSLPSLRYGLPLSNDADKGYVFNVFSNYQEQLARVNQFDTDDVVLSAVGQLNTPIWRRRRAREGFDFIAIDETHLFNINELHIFHHFTRKIGSFPISFSVDQAQGVGDRGWGENDSFSKLFNASSDDEVTNRINTVFRCSPDITHFCATVLASGATLFTNFEDSLANSSSSFTASEERRCRPIKYTECIDDNEMIERAFKKAEALAKETNSKPWEVLLTTLSDNLLEKLTQYVAGKNKPVTLLNKRGDYLKVQSAEKSGHFVLGHADFVGGLEFNVVIIIGVDGGRVPLEAKSNNSASVNFAKYSAHNRLYVASSRAKYALEFLGVKGRGSSELLKASIRSKLIEEC